MNKICTTIEQSKKLIELGIDINTADMLWTYDFTVNDINGLNVISIYLMPEENDIPAWSLSALFELMPLINHDTVNIFKEEDGTYAALYRFTIGSPVITKKESIIDTAFEMVCWLLENKKI